MASSTVVRDGQGLAPPWRARPGTYHELREWGATVGVSLARSYLAFFGTLILVALVPLVCSWDSYVVRSSSMEPTIHIGDVVVASPLKKVADVPLGRVMVFEDPARVTPDTTPRILIHRVITRNDDGSYTSAGDANRQWDTAALPREMILAQARLRVPWVGIADRVVLPWPVHADLGGDRCQCARGVDGCLGHETSSAAAGQR